MTEGHRRPLACGRCNECESGNYQQCSSPRGVCRKECCCGPTQPYTAEEVEHGSYASLRLDRVAATVEALAVMTAAHADLLKRILLWTVAAGMDGTDCVEPEWVVDARTLVTKVKP